MSKSADAFRTISEVADWLGIPAHVLRFWESKFTQVKPVKRAGGRRYYRPADMLLLGGIRKLLHDDGMTIKGVQKVIREQGVRHVAAMSPPLGPEIEDVMADIALDVAETEEPRGRVLSFERGGADAEQDNSEEPSASDSAGASPAPEAPSNDARDAGAAPEAPASEPGSTPDSVPASAASAPPRENSLEDVPDAPEPDAPAPSTPTSDPAESEAPGPKPDAPPATPAGAPVEERTARPEPTTPKTQPAPPDDTAPKPRVARVTVPEDPPDDIDAPPSPLGRLIGRDPAQLAERRPQLHDLAARMAELRERMSRAAQDR